MFSHFRILFVLSPLAKLSNYQLVSRLYNVDLVVCLYLNVYGILLHWIGRCWNWNKFVCTEAEFVWPYFAIMFVSCSICVVLSVHRHFIFFAKRDFALNTNTRKDIECEANNIARYYIEFGPQFNQTHGYIVEPKH